MMTLTTSAAARGVPAPATSPVPGDASPAAEASPALREAAAARVLRDAADRTVDGLLDCAIRSGQRVGWPSWQLDTDGQPQRLTGGDVTLYDGDAGIALALGRLGVALDRTDAGEVAVQGTAAALRHLDDLPPGLLDGHTGAVLAAHLVQASTDVAVPGLGSVGLPPASAIHASDLTSGLAGLGLAQARMGCTRDHAALTVAALRQTARSAAIGLSWADPAPDHTQALCGLAHGASGIAIAAAELAALHDGLPGAADVIAGALRWEATWFDPLAGGWPDLRPGGGGHPALWCHGAAGIAAVRLRLLELADRGVDLGLPSEQVEVDAQMAVQACGRLAAAVGDTLASADPALPASALVPGGLTLCHGLGGPLEVLVQAYQRWDVGAHLALAREVALAVLQRLGPDVMAWPSGVRGVESAGLMVGAAGTAMVLARLADPRGLLPSPSLVG
ncbi:MAG TPA: lanthionine synthetase LanC family protein [Euzebya sp.]|nr:lanthionine synthetase LanC family protein [Euzebya sp.]